MRSRFLAENRWLLRLCSGVARFCGLFLLFGTGVLAAVMIVVTASEANSLAATEESRTQFLHMIPPILFYGFLALILAEFISYLLAEPGEPKWILRHGDKIIYAYVLYTIVTYALSVAHPHAVEREVGSFGSPHQHALDLALTVAVLIVHMLIWIGIAIALRKVVPIVRESKTLA